MIELAEVMPQCGQCIHWTAFSEEPEVGECTGLPPVVLFDQESQSPVMAERQCMSDRPGCVYFKGAL